MKENLLDTAPIDSQFVRAAVVIAALLVAGLWAWTWCLLKWSRRQHCFEMRSGPRSNWQSVPHQSALWLSFLMLGQMLLNRYTASPALNAPLTAEKLVHLILIEGGLGLLFFWFLWAGRRNDQHFGERTDSPGTQLRDGAIGFLLSIVPMAITVLVTWQGRNRNTQNPLLTLLADSPTFVNVLLIVLTAVVLAPLFEELLFRVILQGFLTTVITARYSIPVVAVLFAAVHGVVDGPALLPLALILGHVFHRRHSYLSAVVIHMLFNATMLSLAVLTMTSQ